MSNRFASGKRAIAECDICGFRYKLKELKMTIVRGERTNILACRQCWSPDHPQLSLGKYIVTDPQAIRDPRPDFAGYPQSRARRLPVSAPPLIPAVGWVRIVIT